MPALRMCRCGALAPRGGRCPNCGSGRSGGRSATAHLRTLTATQRQRYKRALTYSQGNRCAACDRIHVRMELDHIVALGLGGDDAYANLQMLCHECHAAKTTQDNRAIRQRRRDEKR